MSAEAAQQSRLAGFFHVGFGAAELGLLARGAALFVLAMPPFDLWFLGPFILAPLLVVLRGKSPRVALSCGFLFGSMAYVGGLHWFAGLFGPFAVGFWGLLALFCGGFAGLFALLQRWWGYRRALLIAPPLWLAVDFFRCEQWPLAFGWLSLGYSSHSQPWLLAVASLVGVYGLTLLLATSSAALAALLSLRDRWASSYAAVVVLVGVTLVLAAPGSSAPQTAAAATTRVRLVQVEDNLTLGLRLAASPGLQPNTVVVFPEYATLDSPLQQPGIRRGLASFARRHRVYLLVGCVEYHDRVGDMRRYDNITLLFAPSGRIVGKYRKHHPIPLFNEGRPGRDYPVFRTAAGALGVAICFDMDFEDVARRVAAKGAEVLVVPTADLSSWGRTQHLQHAAMAPLRAVESGRALVRAAGSGISQVVDARGHVRRSLGFGRRGIVDAVVPRDQRRTVYTRFGYLLPWIVQGAVLLLFAVGWWRRRARGCEGR